MAIFLLCHRVSIIKPSCTFRSSTPGSLTISIDHTQLFEPFLVYEGTTLGLAVFMVLSKLMWIFIWLILRMTPGTAPAKSWAATWAALVFPVLDLVWLKAWTWKWKALYLVISSLRHIVSAQVSRCDSVTAWDQYDLLVKLNSILPEWCQYFLGLKKN